MRVLAEGLRFPEGPVALADGSVLVTELAGGTIARVDPSGAVTRVAETGGSPNGAALGRDGRLYVCNNGGLEWSTGEDGLTVPGSGLARGGNQPPGYRGGAIQVVDLDDGGVTTLYDECEGRRLLGLNDIVFDAYGGFYFTDSGKRRDRDMDFGGLYYAKADGSEIRELAHPLILANGVGLSPAGDRLYVAETVTARIWAWELPAPGTLAGSGPGPAGAELLHTLTGYRLIDSLAVEGDGNVCVATLNVGAITVISPAGEQVEVVPVAADDPIVTNVCFGGAEMRTAFVTSSGRGRLYVGEWARPGLRLEGTSPDGSSQA